MGNEQKIYIHRYQSCLFPPLPERVMLRNKNLFFIAYLKQQSSHVVANHSRGIKKRLSF
jgi:hypothetical protein